MIEEAASIVVESEKDRIGMGVENIEGRTAAVVGFEEPGMGDMLEMEAENIGEYIAVVVVVVDCIVEEGAENIGGHTVGEVVGCIVVVVRIVGKDAENTGSIEGHIVDSEQEVVESIAGEEAGNIGDEHTVVDVERVAECIVEEGHIVIAGVGMQGHIEGQNWVEVKRKRSENELDGEEGHVGEEQVVVGRQWWWRK